MAVKKRSSSCTAVAPSSTANLGPGYDVFGLALDALYDRVRITKVAGKNSGRITIKMSDGAIPAALESNSAGLVIKKMAQDFAITDDLDVVVKKGVPAGYGMGSSAASAAAAAVAFAGLYKLKIDRNKLVEYAAEGEVASAGARHYDNVSASVLGGFIISSVGQDGTIRFIRIEPPKDLLIVVAVPSIPVPAKKTEVARSVLPREVPLKSAVHNVSGASTIVAGFALGDVEMIGRGIDDDVIVEPARKHLIPGYDSVRKNALAAGALAVTISGAGPSMIAFLKGKTKRKQVIKAMEAGFSEAGVKCRTFACGPSKGARIVV
ncbi:homoserine kinase [Nitrososphaera viennensis]|nr:homoserine kinase [Nitrososphaera viennensis]UVS69980.1 homoserine kinase [Nitrososphaera viennensis]